MVSEEIFKKRVADNLAKYRKAAGFTQVELAERLNYSDKSVSKWERGEALPDLYTLMQIAQLLEISVDSITGEEPAAKPAVSGKRKRIVNTLMSVGLVWLCATVLFFVAQFFDGTVLKTHAWMLFVYAVPVCAILLVIFSKRWGRVPEFVTQTLLIWGWAVSIHLTVLLLLPTFGGIVYIYIVAAVLEILDFIWLFRPREKARS